MTRKRENLQAYFAGLFDGEGTVGIYKQPLRNGDSWTTAVTATISMVDGCIPIGLIQKEYPEGKLRKSKRQGNRQNIWILTFNHYNAEKFLREILPYTIVKHEQIKLVLSFLQYKRQFQRSRKRNNLGNFVLETQDHWNRCEWFIDKVKEKKLENSWVNSVNALSNHGLREYRAKLEEVEEDIIFLRETLESVETRLSESNKTKSAQEKEIVQVQPSLGNGFQA